MTHHIWRLTEAGPDNLGLAVCDDGLLLGRTPLVERRDGGFVVRDRAEIERLLRRGHRYIGEADRLMPGLAVVARALNVGDQCLARIAAVQLKLPDLPGPIAREAMETEERLIKFTDAEWDPEKHPRAGTPPNPGWFAPTGGDGGGAANAAPSGREEAGKGPLGVSLLGRMPPPASSFLGELGAAQVAELAAYAARLLGPAGAAVAAFGLLFIPSPNNIHVEGYVPEIPGLRFSWNRDEAQLYLTYDDPGGGQRTFALNVDGDLIRDKDGQVVGRVIGGNRIAIETLALLPDLIKQDEPRLCPAPSPDVAGSDQGRPYEENRSRQYEDFVKLLINPPPNGPTPSGYVYYLPNPAENGQPVSFDDCEKETGNLLFEIKGQGLAKLTIDLPDVMEEQFVDQATRQMEASGGRPVVWIFAEKPAALFARGVFDNTPGLEGITVVHVPWTRRGQK